MDHVTVFRGLRFRAGHRIQANYDTSHTGMTEKKALP